MQEICQEIQSRLLAMQDLKYRDFHGALMPTVEKERIIGIRVPKLRKFAKELAGNPDIGVFLKDLPQQRSWREIRILGCFLKIYPIHITRKIMYMRFCSSR